MTRWKSQLALLVLGMLLYPADMQRGSSSAQAQGSRNAAAAQAKGHKQHASFRQAVDPAAGADSWPWGVAARSKGGPRDLKQQQQGGQANSSGAGEPGAGAAAGSGPAFKMACEESGYCSLGKTQQFVGDISTSECWLLALTKA